MAAGWRLESWNGREISDRIRRAEVSTVQDTIDAAASTAAAGRSGSVANIIADRVEETSHGVTGQWGVFPPPFGQPFYELFFEVGSATVPGDNAKRRAADEQYGQLAARIRQEWGG